MRLGLVVQKVNDAMLLVVDSDNVPNFNRNERKFNVNYNWADNTWYNTAMVRSRDYSE